MKNNDLIKSTLDKFGIFKETDQDKYDRVSTQVFGKSIVWSSTGDATTPLEATVEDKNWKLRINEFPEEELFTLLIEGKAVLSFSEKPSTWSFPAENTGSIAGSVESFS